MLNYDFATPDMRCHTMNYPPDLFFDIETLINVAQPTSIVLLGDCDPAFLNNYQEQKQLLNQNCRIAHIDTANIDSLWELEERFDVGLIVNLIEHVDKTKGQQILSRLRDVLCLQYCLALPLTNKSGKPEIQAPERNAGLNHQSEWPLTDLFSFALSKVASYPVNGIEYGLFKYNISDYKRTPDWLNADNWANPQMWGKYWW